MNKKNIMMIMLLVGWGMCAMAQTHLFVAATGNDGNSGLNWENAKQTVQGAIAIANNNTIIHMKVGLYNLTAEFTVPTGVTVIGGYDPNSSGTDVTNRIYPGYNNNWGIPTLCTILSGNYTHRIATVHGTLEGCIVRYGRTATNGAGVLVDGGTVTHCVLINNMAYNPAETTQAKGGGAYVQNNGSLLNCVVCYNRADNGFGVAGTTGNVTSNTVTQNYATNCGTVADYDGNVYKTVVLGDQCWMRENLRTTHYADGGVIYAGTSTDGSYPRYYNPGASAAETQTFGFLYNRRAVWRGTTGSSSNPSGMQGICPTGWHVPSNAEFDQMTTFLQHDDNNICSNVVANIGKALASQSNWSSSTNSCAVGNDLSSNNITLFTGQPAGFYDGGFKQLYQYAYWMTSNTGYNSNYAALRYLRNTAAELVYYTDGYYPNGYSVRCVKNAN